MDWWLEAPFSRINLYTRSHGCHPMEPQEIKLITYVLTRNSDPPLRTSRCIEARDIASDHYLCVATIQLKLKRQVEQLMRKKPNLSKLKEEETKTKFNIELHNKFEALRDLFEDPKEAWEHMKSTYNAVAIEVLGHAHKPTEEWITEDTWEEIGLRKECKKTLLQERDNDKKNSLVEEYRERDNTVKRKARRDKRDFVDKMAKSSEEAAQRRWYENIISNRKKGRRWLWQKWGKTSKRQVVTQYQMPVNEKQDGQNISMRSWTGHHQKKLWTLHSLKKLILCQ